MAEISIDTSSIGDSTTDSLEMVTQPTVEQEDRNFIQKVINHVQSMPGATREDLQVQTNTGFPSRYVLMLKNLPAISFKDFETIKTLAPRLRKLMISLKGNWLKVDMWKNGAKQKKMKRKHASATKRIWNLKSINVNDKPMLERILNGMSNLPSLPCQFHVTVRAQPPNYYYIDITSNDQLNIEEMALFKHEFRAFVKEITFNFPQNNMRLKIEKASADTAAAVGTRRIVTVYKRNT